MYNLIYVDNQIKNKINVYINEYKDFAKTNKM